MLPKPLRGVVPPMVTPLLDNDTLDIGGLERLVEHILAGHVHGLFLLGTTGEAPNLSYDVRHELVRRVCRQVKGRVPVLVGVTDTVFTESLRLAQTAEKEGAEAVVAAPPYYFATGQPELVEYYTHLANRLPLPLFLYNMPSHTKVMIDPYTAHTLSETPNIVGLKDSSANMIYFHTVRRLARTRPDWTLLTGPEELLAESVLLGGDGGICGGANLWPRLYVDLYRAAQRGDLPSVRQLHDEVMQIATTLYTLPGHGAPVVAGLKGALDCWGICRGILAEPFGPLSDEQRRVIRERLEHLGHDWRQPQIGACPSRQAT